VDSEKGGLCFILEKTKDQYYVVDVVGGDYFGSYTVKDWSKYNSNYKR
jgi:hypothetical protein